MELTMQLETLTPTVAEQMLSHNTRNRKSQIATVKHYARQMAEGLWQLNGDAIRFDHTGVLLDGQHRLQAVVMSGVTVQSWVGRGFPTEAGDTMDQQRKRTAGDIMSMHGITSGDKVAAVVRVVRRWEDGERSMYGFAGTRNVMLTASEVLDIVQKDDIYLAAARISTSREMAVMCPPRIAGSLFVLTNRVDSEGCNFFFERLASGAGLEEGSPILTLRRHWMRLTQDRHRGSNNGVFLMGGVRCWNAYAEGRNLSNVHYKTATIPELSNVRAKVPQTQDDDTDDTDEKEAP